jgi:hypothetical protein
MFKCIQEYLADGLIFPVSENITWKTLENKTNAAFIQWFKHFYENGITGAWCLRTLYDEYVNYHGEKVKTLHMNTVHNGLIFGVEKCYGTHTVTVEARKDDNGVVRQYINFTRVGEAEMVEDAGDLPF